jgi:hypothetical protein
VSAREYIVAIRDQVTGSRALIRVEAPNRELARDRAVVDWQVAARRRSGYRVESITPAGQVDA